MRINKNHLTLQIIQKHGNNVIHFDSLCDAMGPLVGVQMPRTSYLCGIWLLAKWLIKLKKKCFCCSFSEYVNFNTPQGQLFQAQKLFFDKFEIYSNSNLLLQMQLEQITVNENTAINKLRIVTLVLS